MYRRSKIRVVIGVVGLLAAIGFGNTKATVYAAEDIVADEIQEITDTVQDEDFSFTMEKKYAVTTNVSNFGYWVYRPENSLDEKLPLIVYMHGISERGNNLDTLLNVSLPMYLYRGDVSVNAVVIMPQCPASTNWSNLADDVMELINIVKIEENIDESSIGLTGHSLGGIGTWKIAQKYPDVFSSLVPVSGTIKNPAACDTLTDVAVWAFHGALDSMTPSSMLQAQKVIEAAGGTKMQVTLFENKGHCITDIVYNNPEYDVINWMAKQHRSDISTDMKNDLSVDITYAETGVVTQRINYIFGAEAQNVIDIMA